MSVRSMMWHDVSLMRSALHSSLLIQNVSLCGMLLSAIGAAGSLLITT
jgi:hypothetical protein